MEVDTFHLKNGLYSKWPLVKEEKLRQQTINQPSTAYKAIDKLDLASLSSLISHPKTVTTFQPLWPCFSSGNFKFFPHSRSWGHPFLSANTAFPPTLC